MTDQFIFPAKLTWSIEDQRFFVAFSGDLTWVFTTGSDPVDARMQAADALETAMMYYMHKGLAIPRASRPKRGEIIIAMGPVMTAKAALYEAMREAGMSNVALAKKLGVAETEVRRLLSPRHNSKIERLDKALAVFGKHIVVQIAAE
jgi:antitoxin HicB